MPIILIHRITVSIYLLYMLIIASLLIIGRKDLFEKVREKFKYARMAVETLFLLTGIWLLTQTAYLSSPWLWVKIGLVLATVGITVVGTRKQNGMLIALGLIILLYVYGVAELKSLTMQKKSAQLDAASKGGVQGEDPAKASGKAVYTTYCLQCHGADGKLGFSGAKDITATTLDDSGLRKLVREGKGAMPANTEISDTQLEDLIGFVRTLKP